MTASKRRNFSSEMWQAMRCPSSDSCTGGASRSQMGPKFFWAVGGRVENNFPNNLQSGAWTSSPIFHQPCDTTHTAIHLVRAAKLSNKVGFPRSKKSCGKRSRLYTVFNVALG